MPETGAPRLGTLVWKEQESSTNSNDLHYLASSKEASFCPFCVFLKYVQFFSHFGEGLFTHFVKEIEVLYGGYSLEKK